MRKGQVTVKHSPCCSFSRILIVFGICLIAALAAIGVSQMSALAMEQRIDGAALHAIAPSHAKLRTATPVPDPPRTSRAARSGARTKIPKPRSTARALQESGGLRGEYYDNKDLTALKFARTDPQVNFAWGDSSPDPSLGADTFSVRWSGWLVARYSEIYDLILRSDDGVRLWLNGQLVIDGWTDHLTAQTVVQIPLTAGARHSIKLEYYDNTGYAFVSLRWRSTSQALEVIPVSQFIPSSSATPTRTNTAVATAIRSATPTRTATRTPTTDPCPSALLPPEPIGILAAPPVHRISVRLVNGLGGFYDTTSGAKFIPRGNNYVRLAQQQFCFWGASVYHSTFDPARYDATTVAQAFGAMRDQGYNVARVFLNYCCTRGGIGSPNGGLDGAYVDRVADLLQRAKANGLYVLLTLDALPQVGGYEQLQNANAPSQFQGENRTLLTRGGIDAHKRLWRDLIRGLLARGAPLEVIFAYELMNETFFNSTLLPLSMNSGVVTAANGLGYDMSKFDDKVRLMDEGMLYWADQVRAGIRELDPSALVTIGFTGHNWNIYPDQPLPRLIVRSRSTINNSKLDWIDLHAYPGHTTMADFAGGTGVSSTTVKPLVLGEYGVRKLTAPTVAQAADVLKNWQIASCGFGFDGWLLWTWDTTEAPEMWNGQSEGGLIAQTLSPKARPDACK